MWITDPCRMLDSYDVTSLAGKIRRLPEKVWQKDEQVLQNLTKNRQSQSVFLLSISAQKFRDILASRPLTEADIDRHGGWQELCQPLAPVIEKALSHYPAGGIVTRVQLARMQPGSVIKPHIDQSPMLVASHRVHLPIITNKGVEFVIDSRPTTMEAGKFYELNNRLTHTVTNKGSEDRIHLLIDYLPPENNLPAALAAGHEQRRKQRMLNNTSPPPVARHDIALPTIIATSVVRGAHKKESHGGIYLVDLHTESIKQVVDWNTCDISFEGRGWDRGLRGIAFHGQEIYIAASDELFCFDRNFSISASWRNPWLKHAHEIFCYGDHLLVTSTGFDSILRFDLVSKQFDRGWLIRPGGRSNLNLSIFHPSTSGPKEGNKLHINNVYQDSESIYVSGQALPFLLFIDDKKFGPVAGLPTGTHNAMPFRNGVIYHDTNADLVSQEEGNEFCYLDVPRYEDSELVNADLGDERLARQAFGRGLCVYGHDVVISGSSPSTITAYDLRARTAIKSLNITMDIRHAIHGLEVWPANWHVNY